MHHRITSNEKKPAPPSGEHWYATYRKAEKRFAAEEEATGKTEGSTEIDRLRGQLSHLDPKKDAAAYRETHEQLTRAYADTYPGVEEDNAR